MSRALPSAWREKALSRRLAACLCALCLAQLGPLAVAQDKTAEVRIHWQLPVVQKDEILSLLDAEPEVTPVQPEDEGRRGVLMILLVGVVSLPYLADALIAAHRDVMLGGVVIDACGDELKIRNDHSLPGEIAVVRCGDEIEIDIWRPRERTSSELIGLLLQALKGSK